MPLLMSWPPNRAQDRFDVARMVFCLVLGSPAKAE
jgi:hypothetical protein